MRIKYRDDPFDVFGRPPQSVMDRLGIEGRKQLRRYMRRVVRKIYRVAEIDIEMRKPAEN